MKKEKWKKKAYLYFSLVALIMVVILIIAYLFYTPVYPPSIFVLGYNKEKIDGNYKLTVTEVEADDSIKLENVKIVIVNKSFYPIFQQTLDRLKDNESSSIIFYDKDNNNALSKGDVFIIKREMISEAYGFQMVNKESSSGVYLLKEQD